MSSSAKHTHAAICPYMGVKNDPNSHMAFPTPLNYCHLCYPSAAVNLTHQADHCLGEKYPSCEVYTAGEGKPLPKHLRMKNAARSAAISPLFLSIFLGIVLAVAVYLWFVNAQSALVTAPVDETIPAAQSSLTVEEMVAQTVTAISLAETQAMQLSQATPAEGDPSLLTPSITPSVTPFPTLTNTPTKTATITSTPTVTRTPTPTFTPSATATVTFTATPIPPFSLDYPIGVDQKYIIHRVSPGENMNLLAEKYATTIDAILAVNYTVPSPIRDGTIVIIPLNVTSAAGLPIFEAYQVTVPLITVEEIAVITNADPERVRFYNNCAPGQTLTMRSWLLIPRDIRIQQP